jgi:hypothetical protein
MNKNVANNILKFSFFPENHARLGLFNPLTPASLGNEIKNTQADIHISAIHYKLPLRLSGMQEQPRL